MIFQTWTGDGEMQKQLSTNREMQIEHGHYWVNECIKYINKKIISTRFTFWLIRM